MSKITNVCHITAENLQHVTRQSCEKAANLNLQTVVDVFRLVYLGVLKTISLFTRLLRSSPKKSGSYGQVLPSRSLRKIGNLTESV